MGSVEAWALGVVKGALLQGAAWDAGHRTAVVSGGE